MTSRMDFVFRSAGVAIALGALIHGVGCVFETPLDCANYPGPIVRRTARARRRYGCGR
jgi:hypothetical protein